MEWERQWVYYKFIKVNGHSRTPGYCANSNAWVISKIHCTNLVLLITWLGVAPLLSLADPSISSRQNCELKQRLAFETITRETVIEWVTGETDSRRRDGGRDGADFLFLFSQTPTSCRIHFFKIIFPFQAFRKQVTTQRVREAASQLLFFSINKGWNMCFSSHNCPKLCSSCRCLELDLHKKGNTWK